MERDKDFLTAAKLVKDFLSVIVCETLSGEGVRLTSAKVFVKDICKGNKHCSRLIKFVFATETEGAKFHHNAILRKKSIIEFYHLV